MKRRPSERYPFKKQQLLSFSLLSLSKGAGMTSQTDRKQLKRRSGFKIRRRTCGPSPMESLAPHAASATRFDTIARNEARSLANWRMPSASFSVAMASSLISQR